MRIIVADEDHTPKFERLILAMEKLTFCPFDKEHERTKELKQKAIEAFEIALGERIEKYKPHL